MGGAGTLMGRRNYWHGHCQSRLCSSHQLLRAAAVGVLQGLRELSLAYSSGSGGQH